MGSGVPITGTLRTYTGGQYPTNDPLTEIDGWRSVADSTARDAIPNWLRRQGMAVALQSNGQIWSLNAPPWIGTVADWTLLGTVGTIGSVTSVGLTMPGGFAVSGSPITGNGTLAVTTSLSGILQAASGSISTITVGTGLTFTGGTLAATSGVLIAKPPACFAATTANLNATYNNGTLGVGATLTNAGTQAAFTIDGATFSGGERVLVKNQTTQANNGIYTVTTLGSGSTNWVLTRTTDFNQSSNINTGDYVIVGTGTVNAGTLWVNTALGPFTVGTTAIVFTELMVAPLTLTLTGDTTGIGTGTIATTTGKVNGVSYPASPGVNTVPVITSTNTVTYEALPNAALANSSLTITAGTGLTGGGSVSLGGSVTVSLAVPVAVSQGGTGDTSLTAYAVLCGGTTSTGAVQSLASLGTAGAVLTSNGPGALPSFQAITGTGSVTSISQGIGIALTPNPIVTTGTVAMATAGINSLAGYDASGVFANVAIGAGLTLSGNTLSANITGAGVVSITAGTSLNATPTNPITSSGTINVATGGIGTTQLATNAVTNIKMAMGTANTLAGYDISGNFTGITVEGGSLLLSGGALYTQGGLITFTSYAARNAYPDAFRAEGMIAYIDSSATDGTGDTYWQLAAPPWVHTNDDWIISGPLQIDHNGTVVAVRGTINLIDGPGITLTVTDDPTNDRANITIATPSAQLTATTTDATPTTLLIGGSGGTEPLIPASTTVGFVAYIVGRVSGGAGGAFFLRAGLIHNDGGTTAVLGSDSGITADVNTGAYSVTITADSVVGALLIQVTGAASTTIDWTCRLDMVEVT